MNVTIADAIRAEQDAQAQRFANGRFLRAALDGTDQGTADLAGRVLDAARTSPQEFDRALASRAVNALFARGILFFSTQPFKRKP